MAADIHGASTPSDALAVILAAIGELEAENITNRQGSRAPHASDVQKRLEQVGVSMDRVRIVETLRVAIGELGLATGVEALGEDGKPDMRSLHVTMNGVRWLREAIKRQRGGQDAG